MTNTDLGGPGAGQAGGHSAVTAYLKYILQNYPTALSFSVLVVSVLVFGLIVGERFFTPFNLSLILQQVTTIALLSVAQTLIILTAGVDLSVGTLMVFSMVVMSQSAVGSTLGGSGLGLPQWSAVALGLTVGLLGGLLNGVLVTLGRVPPFIVTLGTWYIFMALGLWYSGGMTILYNDIISTAPILEVFGNGVSFGGMKFTLGTLAMLSVYAIMWYVLKMTAWGRHVYAVGDDIEAARLSGINIRRTLIAVYVVAGLICALAGWVQIGRVGSVTPSESQMANLDTITAVVIGGVSLFGGRGSIVGSLIGALIVGVFRNGLSLAGVDALWQVFAIGVLIIIAVATDQWIRKLVA